MKNRRNKKEISKVDERKRKVKKQKCKETEMQRTEPISKCVFFKFLNSCHYHLKW